jgi:hypothetical protein
MRTAPQCLLGGEPKIPDRARMIASILEMPRELIRICIGLCTVCCFEFLAYEAMQS